ncbi:hypothetical protein SAMN05216565_11233, partial [Litchfieldia salsa]
FAGLSFYFAGFGAKFVGKIRTRATEKGLRGNKFEIRGITVLFRGIRCKVRGKKDHPPRELQAPSNLAS